MSSLLSLSSCGSSGGDSTVSDAPADVIIAIGDSASMDLEIALVQDLINTFAATLEVNAIDLHIIVIASGLRFCAPAPLGSGNCLDDENLPNYRHADYTVSTSDSLQAILDSYPSWSSSLRANATKTIIVVSDDDSALAASSFDSSLIALDSSFTG